MRNKEKLERGEVAEVIKKNFLQNSYVLDYNKRSHFMVRVYRATGDEKVFNPIVEKLLIDKENFLEDLKKIEDKKYREERGKELQKKREKEVKSKGKKYRERKKLFIKEPQHLFYYNLITSLYFWKQFGINRGKMKKLWEKGIKFLKNIKGSGEFKEFILGKGMVTHFGTQLVNCVYYLKFLGVIDLEKEFRERFREIFFGGKNLSDYLYKNKIYGLTHFIIAATNYYQKYISREGFEWILDYFKENIMEIIERTNVDIVSEVGLCFKLCKEKAKEVDEKVWIEIKNNFEEELGYIPRKDKSLNSSEHCNSVAYLFLVGQDKLRIGPDLCQKFEEKIQDGL